MNRYIDDLIKEDGVSTSGCHNETLQSSLGRSPSTEYSSQWSQCMWLSFWFPIGFPSMHTLRLLDVSSVTLSFSLPTVHVIIQELYMKAMEVYTPQLHSCYPGVSLVLTVWFKRKSTVFIHLEIQSFLKVFAGLGHNHIFS